MQKEGAILEVVGGRRCYHHYAPRVAMPPMLRHQRRLQPDPEFAKKESATAVAAAAGVHLGTDDDTTLITGAMALALAF
jgi:hypothetical protein